MLVLLLMWWQPVVAAFPLSIEGMQQHRQPHSCKQTSHTTDDSLPAKPIDRRKAILYAILSVSFGTWFLGGKARRYLGYRKAAIMQLLGPPMLYIVAVCWWMGWWIPALLLFAWAAAMQVWMVTDLIRIVLNRLKPANGLYYLSKGAAVPPAF
jgi:hypothetical protein